MAELVYFTGPMDCGKSTLALQLDYTYTAAGRRGRMFTSRDRAGEATISSRLGLTRPAHEVTSGFDFWTFAEACRSSGEPLDYVVADEAQFYTAVQVDQLARLVDDREVDVFAFGILSDFQTRLFPGSQRLVELSDRIEPLQLPAFCWCGRRATHNARTLDGELVREGNQVVPGFTSASEGYPSGGVGGRPPTRPTDTTDLSATVSYEVLCRRHHLQGMTRARASATEEKAR